MRDFASNERVAHFFCAVPHPVRGCHGVFRLNEPHFQLAGLFSDAVTETVVNCFYLTLDAQIALRIALVTDDADRGFMDEFDIGPKLTGNTDSLRTATGVFVNQNRPRILHV